MLRASRRRIYCGHACALHGTWHYDLMVDTSTLVTGSTNHVVDGEWALSAFLRGTDNAQYNRTILRQVHAAYLAVKHPCHLGHPL